MVLTKEKKAKSKIMKTYGKELILDIYNCDPSTFTRESIGKYFEELCEVIDMEKCDLHWWDDLGTPPEDRETEPHLVGTSAVQFIKTSSIVIHSLDILKRVYLNIFSCKDFDADVAKKFSEDWFSGKSIASHVIERR